MLRLCASAGVRVCGAWLTLWCHGACRACAAADMLKMLARKWKMHTQPGFWQTHQTRVQLALALRNFIKAKKLQLGGACTPSVRHSARAVPAHVIHTCHAHWGFECRACAHQGRG